MMGSTCDATGSRDTFLIAWSLSTFSPLHHLKGHKYQVCPAGTADFSYITWFILLTRLQIIASSPSSCRSWTCTSASHSNSSNLSDWPSSTTCMISSCTYASCTLSLACMGSLQTWANQLSWLRPDASLDQLLAMQPDALKMTV